MKKQYVFIPILLVSSLFMALYVMDAQAQSPASSQAPTIPQNPAASGAPDNPAAAKPRTLAAPACSGFYGTFKATNWPGGKLTLTCPGKSRPRGKCVGASAQLMPGEGFSFNNCNCLDPQTKCLTVSNLPPGCKVTSTLACASNRETLDGSFQVECSDEEPTASDPCASPSEPAAGTSMAPSFVCLGLGEVGGCLTPTLPAPCTSAVPSGIIPSGINPPGGGINVPDINSPDINAPDINPPDINSPDINPPDINIPNIDPSDLIPSGIIPSNVDIP